MANEHTAGGIEALPGLLGRLADQITTLFDAKIALLRVELKEELQTYLRNGVLLAIGAVVAMAGLALLNIALALFLSLLFSQTQLSPSARYALGFALAAILYLAVGTILIVRAKNQIKKQGVLPRRTTLELARDKEFLTNQF